MHTQKTALITGATSGIGTIIAHHLARNGFRLIVLGRSPQKLKELLEQIHALYPQSSVLEITCDLTSFQDMQNACNQIKNEMDTIDVCIMNAGIMNFKEITTSDGYEETWQVNLLAPMFLFNQLATIIPKNEESKIIITASALHKGVIHWDNLAFKKHFSAFKTYSQSKLGVIMLSRWLAQQKAYTGWHFYSIHPGMVNTQLGRNAGWMARIIFKLFGKSPQQGAQTHQFVIDTPNSQLQNGAYYAHKRVTRTSAYSYDMVAAQRLWKIVKSQFPKSAGTSSY